VNQCLDGTANPGPQRRRVPNKATLDAAELDEGSLRTYFAKLAMERQSTSPRVSRTLAPVSRRRFEAGGMGAPGAPEEVTRAKQPLTKDSCVGFLYVRGASRRRVSACASYLLLPRNGLGGVGRAWSPAPLTGTVCVRVCVRAVHGARNLPPAFSLGMSRRCSGRVHDAA
jgi:hypothetical protein